MIFIQVSTPTTCHVSFMRLSEERFVGREREQTNTTYQTSCTSSQTTVHLLYLFETCSAFRSCNAITAHLTICPQSKPKTLSPQHTISMHSDLSSSIHQKVPHHDFHSSLVIKDAWELQCGTVSRSYFVQRVHSLPADNNRWWWYW